MSAQGGAGVELDPAGRVLKGVVLNLRTRMPTCEVPWPLLLVEGFEKSGKAYSAAKLTASPHVGRCFWIDLSEGSGDEYGAIPGARYEVVEHDGSFAGLLAAVKELHRYGATVLAAGGKPIVVILDNMGAEWDLLKDWAADRCRSSRKNRAILARDPNAEIQVTMPYWNDATARHRSLMKLLKTFPGIFVMIAQGKEVAVVGPDGNPVEGRKDHKVEAQKGLGADATLWVRLFRDRPGEIVGGRSVHLDLRPGSGAKPLTENWTLENLIFKLLGCNPVTAHTRKMIDRTPDSVTPEQIRDEITDPRTTFERLGQLREQILACGFEDVVLMNETGEDEPLLHMVDRHGRERRPASDPVVRNIHVAPERPQDQPVIQPAAAPGPAAEAVTDQRWLESARRSVANAPMAGLPVLKATFAQQAARGKASPADWAALEAEINAKMAQEEVPAA